MEVPRLETLTCSDQSIFRENSPLLQPKQSVQLSDQLISLADANPEGRSGFCSSLYSFFASIGQAVSRGVRFLFCCGAKKVDPAVVKIKELQTERDEFQALHDNFITERDADTTLHKRAFKDKWIERFDQLSGDRQKRFVCKDMESNARNKLGNRAPRPQIDKWVKEAYDANTLGVIANARAYIRDLNPVQLPSGTRIDPMEDDEVPEKILDIIRDIQNEIDALGVEEE